MSANVHNSILRRKQVEQRTGLCRSAIYQGVKDGSFPKPILLTGKRAVGWLERDIDLWIKKRVSLSRKTIREQTRPVRQVVNAA